MASSTDAWRMEMIFPILLRIIFVESKRTRGASRYELCVGWIPMCPRLYCSINFSFSSHRRLATPALCKVRFGHQLCIICIIPWQYLTSLLHFKGGLLKSGSSWGSTHLNVPYTLVSRCPKKHLHLFSAVALKIDSNLCMLLNTFQKLFFLISPPISRAPSLVRSRRQQCCVGSPIYFATWQLIGFNWDWFSIICPSYISRSVKLGNVSSYN